MPDPRWESGLGKSGVLLRQRQPGISAEEDFKISQTESNRRVRDAVATVEAAVAKTPTAAAPVSVAPAPPPPKPDLIIDRLHKQATSKYGGYVFIGPIHDSVDLDPFQNSGYPLDNTTAATLNVGLQKAMVMLQKVKPGERVALIVLSSGWNESLTIPVAGIDIFGVGQPRIHGSAIVLPTADTSFFNIDVNSVGTNPAIWYQPAPPAVPTQFLPVAPGLYGVRASGGGGQRALYAQRRFHAEESQFVQLDPTASMQHEFGTIRVESFGVDVGYSEMKRCQIYSFIDGTQWNTWGATPTGFALEARAMMPGTFDIGQIGDELGYILPSSGLLLDHCEVYGSALVDRWTLKHRKCSCVGPRGIEVGGEYVRAYGQPLGNPEFYGNAVPIITFDHTEIKSRVIVNVVGWPTPIGGVHFGECYVAIRQSEHLIPWNTTLGAAFVSTGSGQGIADIVNSPTPGLSWTAFANWAVTTWGSCPTSVTAQRELYQL